MEIEYNDVVDEKDRVIGKATKQEVNEKKLRHRIVHVLLFNKKGEMALQLRHRNHKYCPHHWSTAVGGYVQAGESYEQGALREYEEELGTRSEMKFLFKELYKVPGVAEKFIVVYTTTYEGKFDIDTEKVEKVEYFSLKKIQEMIDSEEKFHPELLFILRKYYGLK